jgi:hypothetical protein
MSNYTRWTSTWKRVGAFRKRGVSLPWEGKGTKRSNSSRGYQRSIAILRRVTETLCLNTSIYQLIRMMTRMTMRILGFKDSLKITIASPLVPCSRVQVQWWSDNRTTMSSRALGSPKSNYRSKCRQQSREIPWSWNYLIITRITERFSSRKGTNLQPICKGRMT